MIGPVPARVDGAVKADLLTIIDDAVAGGWTVAKVCLVLGLDRQRVWRWHTRRQGGVLTRPVSPHHQTTRPHQT